MMLAIFLSFPSSKGSIGVEKSRYADIVGMLDKVEGDVRSL